MATESDHSEAFDGANWIPNRDHPIQLDSAERSTLIEAPEGGWANEESYKRLFEAAGRAATANNQEWSE